MFDSVEVDRKTGTAWSEELQKTVDVYSPVYAGAARVALPHGTPIVTTSGELVTPRTALVTIPWGNTPREGDRVRVIGPRAGVPEYVWVQAIEASAIPTACRMACGAQ
ncbi:hypothetical protein Y09_1334 [Brachybacterium sp. SW0106-09]|nr:hypothetical protein Y09_1334 [Brachybacterium sp. SW0106-09]